MALSKNEIRLIQSLHLKKFRQKYHKFLAEGVKIALEALQQPRFRIHLLCATPDWLHDYAPQITSLPAAVIREVSEMELTKISTLTTPNKVLLVLDMPDKATPEGLSIPGKALFLDNMQDPGNLGAILRIADWFGIPQVFCSPDSVDAFNPKVVQAGMGAFLRVQCQEVELAALRQANSELPVLGALLQGSNVFETALPARGILVIGNESKGIRAVNQPLIDLALSIPRAANGGAESLNAAVAAGILAALWQQAKA